jgi:hypothetical protein
MQFASAMICALRPATAEVLQVASMTDSTVFAATSASSESVCSSDSRS